MVTSNNLPDKKVVKMSEQNNGAVVPQRTLLGEVNEHITCPLCHGYYIDATTIVECLHSFCRSCIIKHLHIKSYCPVCEMMINSAKPNIKLDKALQDIVYKLVPGLFQKEMERRQHFYSSRPGPAATATPEQRGEDTERIIFSPEDVISFSLEYADLTDNESISSKSSDSNEPPTSTTRRFLQCPAVVNISHLKKFLSMKFDIDSTLFAIDILYKRVPLPDYYTLMDIAYIFNWKRNEPIRFFYQIIDYIAIRSRLFDINKKDSDFHDRKASPTLTEETNVSSPNLNLNDNGSDVSSRANSPTMLEDGKKVDETKSFKTKLNIQENLSKSSLPSSSKKCNEDEEKSQFLISFELTAKSNNTPTTPTVKTMNKSNINDIVQTLKDSPIINYRMSKIDEALKRKLPLSTNPTEVKKLKADVEKVSPSSLSNNSTGVSTTQNHSLKKCDSTVKSKENEGGKISDPTTSNNTFDLKTALDPLKDRHSHSASEVLPKVLDAHDMKRNLAGPSKISSKPITGAETSVPFQSSSQKLVSPLKLQVPKLESQQVIPKSNIQSKPPVKKMPDLKPSPASFQNKGQPSKLRMDLLANNSDPTIDRSKILSQVNTSLNAANSGQPTGDSLKNLFDSCKINIPSSLSITLTDQKLDPRNTSETPNIDLKQSIVNKSLATVTNTASHKTPSPPVHNYIEILKLPEADSKKQQKSDCNPELTNVKTEVNSPTQIQTKPATKVSEISAKGPIPNLKPIGDTKICKQSGNFSGPITFQQTFEQQLQTLQSDKKTKLPKNKAQVPKLVPATPKAFSANKSTNSSNKLANATSISENKAGAALDLSTPHNIPSQLATQQAKAFEAMQFIANLAKKQSVAAKGLLAATSQSNIFPTVSNRSLSSITSMRSANSHPKLESQLSGLQNVNNKPELCSKVRQTTTPSAGFVNYQMSVHHSPNNAQPSPRQTRSPSSSPKLVIAEENSLVYLNKFKR